MDWKDVEKKWSQFRVSVQERWGELTSEELDQIGGSYDRLVSKLQEKYGITRQQAEHELAEFQNTVRA
jgi:uncharacterized protein YjbJ (UPF0337 family)